MEILPHLTLGFTKMKKFKIALTVTLICLASTSVHAGPTKQKPPVSVESSFYQTVMEFFGLTE